MIGPENPNLVHLRKKSKCPLLRGNCVLLATRQRLGSTEERTPMSARLRLFAFLPGFEPTYAAWPVWSGSTSKPVQFTPLPKKAALRLWQYARDFDRQTKEKGCHGGAVGHTGLN